MSTFAEGDRIRLVHMPDDPDPIPVGTTGTITLIHGFEDCTQLSVDWDNGRRLGLVIPPDVIEKVEDDA